MSERHTKGTARLGTLPGSRSPSAYDRSGDIRWSPARNGLPAPDGVAWQHGDGQRADDAREAGVQAALAAIREKARANLRAQLGDALVDALEAELAEGTVTW